MSNDKNIVVQALQCVRELSGKDKEDLIRLNQVFLPLSEADLVYINLPDENGEYSRQGIITNGKILLYNGEELEFNEEELKKKDLQFSYRGVIKKYEDIKYLLKDKFAVNDIQSVTKRFMKTVFVQFNCRKRKVLFGNQFGTTDVPLVESFDTKKLSAIVPGTLVDVQLSDDEKICEINEIKESELSDVNPKVLYSIGVLLYDSAEKELLLGKADSPSFVDFILMLSSVLENHANEDILDDEQIYRYMSPDELKSLKSDVLKAYSYKLDRKCLIKMLNDKSVKIEVEQEYSNEILRWKGKEEGSKQGKEKPALSYDTLYKVQEFIEEKFSDKFDKTKSALLNKMKSRGNLLNKIKDKVSKISEESREDPLKMNFENWSTIKGVAEVEDLKYLNVNSEFKVEQAKILESILNALNREAFLKKAVDLLKERITNSIDHDHYVEWLKILPETRKYWNTNADNMRRLRRVIQRLYLVDVKDVKQDLNLWLKKKTFEYNQGFKWIRFDNVKEKVIQEDAQLFLNIIQKLSSDTTSEISVLHFESTVTKNEILFKDEDDLTQKFSRMEIVGTTSTISQPQTVISYSQYAPNKEQQFTDMNELNQRFSNLSVGLRANLSEDLRKLDDCKQREPNSILVCTWNIPRNKVTYLSLAYLPKELQNLLLEADVLFLQEFSSEHAAKNLAYDFKGFIPFVENLKGKTSQDDFAVTLVKQAAYLQYPCSDTRFFVSEVTQTGYCRYINVHIDHNKAELKEETCRKLVEEVEKLAGRPVIIGGDFNVELAKTDSRSKVYPILSTLFNPDSGYGHSGYGHSDYGHSGFGHSGIKGIQNVLFSKQHFDLLHSFIVDYKVEEGGHCPLFVLLKRK